MKRILIAGGGPAGLMVAEQLVGMNCEVTLLEAKKAPGRKFLVAGHGGFNLSHAGELDDLLKKYNRELLRQAVQQFDNDATIAWLKKIGIPTYVGSSGKIFPERGIKPIEVLKAWLSSLQDRGLQLLTEHRLTDWQDATALVDHNGTQIRLKFDHLVLALGGASWKKTGSDGKWTTLLREKEMELVPFQASNAGMVVKGWKEELRGVILKNVRVRMGDQEEFGELLFTDYGLEGAPVYALNARFREGVRLLTIDLKPHNTCSELESRLEKTRGNRRKQLEQLNVHPTVIGRIKEGMTREEYLEDESLAKQLKQLPFEIEELRPIDEAISTVGGIAVMNLSEQFEWQSRPGVWCVGEMIDWDAPTGGYLLQGCFASGYVAGKALAERISQCAEG